MVSRSSLTPRGSTLWLCAVTRLQQPRAYSLARTVSQEVSSELSKRTCSATVRIRGEIDGVWDKLPGYSIATSVTGCSSKRLGDIQCSRPHPLSRSSPRPCRAVPVASTSSRAPLVPSLGLAMPWPETTAGKTLLRSTFDRPRKETPAPRPLIRSVREAEKEPKRLRSGYLILQ
ncbi:hypothetical protein GGR56DRAFT_337188 [Xylariaceae sp. FL0804]|nr:hypothetical protein GGR56DRAFT_337188 [Xylariaceae sp. FL0804]